MFKNIKLRTRLLLSICTVALISFTITIGFVAIKARKLSQEQALITAEETAYHYSGQVQAELEVGMDAARTLAQCFEGLKKTDGVAAREAMNNMLIQVLKKNPNFIGIWTVWEPNALDNLDSQYINKKGHDATGRFIPYWNRGSGQIIVEPLADYATPGAGDYYLAPLKSGNETITEPYYYSIAGKDTLLTSLAVPIKIGNQTIGVVGVDLSLAGFEALIDKVKPFEIGYGALLSNEGVFVGHPKKELVGKNVSDFVGQEIIKAIRKGESESLTQKSVKSKTTSYFHFVPIQIGQTTTPWSFAVVAPLDKILEGANSITRSAIVIGVISMFVFIIVVFFLSGSIITPIKKIALGIDDIAQGEGDLTARLKVSRQDEVGELAGGFNLFVEKLHGMISQIQSNLSTLNSSAKNLSDVSGDLSLGSDDASIKSNTVATAAEEMSANMNTVAAASEQAATNVNMVASAAEEMSATVNEIAGNTSKARAISEQAVSKTTSASQRMDELGGAAQEISKVTEAITEISEQTNLLALNATIEAARAGESGKGFAVVANEIKELAKQTAEATLEIRQKIDAIQSSTKLTVTEMAEISVVINDVNDIVNTIATAVEEQSASTNEIATNVLQAAQGIAEVNENVSQSSTVSDQISQEISGVSQIANTIKEDSTKVSNQADELSALSIQLAKIVNQFKL
ncbi:MAG: methyl-accepting chemotaxis protein [Desulfotalea sp.]